MSEFQTYLPETWFEDGLALAASMEPAKKVEYSEKRDSQWHFEVPAAVIAAGALAFFSISYGEDATASTLNSMILPSSYGASIAGEHHVQKDPILSPLRKINRGFNELFDSFRSGERPQKSAEIRKLASAATQHRNEKVDVNEWAKMLANDLKDADD